MITNWTTSSRLNGWVDKTLDGIIDGSLKADSDAGISRGAIAEFLGIGVIEAGKVACEVRTVMDLFRASR